MEKEWGILTVNTGLPLHNFILRFLFSHLFVLCSFCDSSTPSFYFLNLLPIMNVQVVGYTKDASGRVLYESTACITVMLSRVSMGLKSSRSAGNPEAVSASPVEETSREILDHARTSGFVDLLCLCLSTSGSVLMAGCSNMLPAACEACKAIWALVDALEFVTLKGHAYLFPLNSLRSHSLLRLNIRDNDHGSLHETESDKIIEMVVRTLLKSKQVQVAIYYCLHQGLESTLSAAIQVHVLSYLISAAIHVHVLSYLIYAHNSFAIT